MSIAETVLDWLGVKDYAVKTAEAATKKALDTATNGVQQKIQDLTSASTTPTTPATSPSDTTDPSQQTTTPPAAGGFDLGKILSTLVSGLTGSSSSSSSSDGSSPIWDFLENKTGGWTGLFKVIHVIASMIGDLISAFTGGGTSSSNEPSTGGQSTGAAGAGGSTNQSAASVASGVAPSGTRYPVSSAQGAPTSSPTTPYPFDKLLAESAENARKPI